MLFEEKMIGKLQQEVKFQEVAQSDQHEESDFSMIRNRHIESTEADHSQNKKSHDISDAIVLDENGRRKPPADIDQAYRIPPANIDKS